MKIKPERDYIVVLQDETREDVTSSGIIVAASKGIKASQEQLGRTGTIKAAGPEVDRDQLKVEDKVCYGEFAHPEYTEDGVRYIVMRDKDIVGVIE